MSEIFGFKQNFSMNCTVPMRDSATSLWFILQKDTIFLAGKGEHFTVPCTAAPPVTTQSTAYSRCVGIYQDTNCMVLEAEENPGIDGLTPFSLREAHAHIGTDLWTIAGRASQILRWRRDHKFCGRCGTGMKEDLLESLMKCPQCGFFTYPRISPAVIMSIVKDDKILLGRSPRFPTGMYSVLAGFVEPGETLEEAVAREVKEETNIDITDIQYIASQPWPFPHSLMVGFTARYAGGTIKVDNDELEDAAWFSATDLPRLPTPISIARKLIELHLKNIAG